MSESPPSTRHLPVRPNLDELKQQADELLRSLHVRDAKAVAEFRQQHPDPCKPADATIADARLTLARSYGVASWPRLVMACRMTDAIWRDDLDAVRDIVTRHPELIEEDARGVKGNCDTPMSYAANLGRDRISQLLRELGASAVRGG